MKPQDDLVADEKGRDLALVMKACRNDPDEFEALEELHQMYVPF